MDGLIVQNGRTPKELAGSLQKLSIPFLTFMSRTTCSWLLYLFGLGSDAIHDLFKTISKIWFGLLHLRYFLLGLDQQSFMLT